MDYCSTCRRHLNGALVCPGCGAYAPDIAPATSDGHIVPAPLATAAVTGAAVAPESTAWDTWQDGRLRHGVDETAVGDGMEWVPQTSPSDGLEGVPSAPQGRAARRRQRARWKKNQRRAVVATAVALVGGGLTLASTDRQSGDRAQAATAPMDPGTGAVEEQSAQEARPTSAQPDAHRSSPTPSAHSSAPDLAHRKYATDSLRTTPDARPDSSATPRTTVADPQPQSTAAAVPDGTDTSDTTDTTPAQTPAPATTDGTDSGTSQESPEPTTTSPSHICVLVLCLG